MKLRRPASDRGAELGAIVLFCLGVELACIAAWIFG